MNAPLDRALKDALAQALGHDHVLEDAASLALAAQDIWAKSEHDVACVVQPSDVEGLAVAVGLLARAGRVIAIRGGGMSYTLGYVPVKPGTITIDLARMDKVLAVDVDAMTVTVEAGCTWQTLHDALKPLGLRTPFWGPLSGLASTIGGGLSQLNALFGAGAYGTTSESVVGLDLVLADGRRMRTGAIRPSTGRPFFRHFGPDMTGLFCGDCGALAIKAAITLRLIPWPKAEAYASFAFADHAGAIGAMADIAKAGLACEAFGFDPTLAKMRLKRASLMADLATLGQVASGPGGLLKGMQQVAKIALAGRSFIEEDTYTIHAVCEGRSKAAVDADLAEIRRIAGVHGGAAIADTIPAVMRAQPFAPLNSILGPEGERWVPVHGIIAMGDARAAFEALQDLFAKHAAAFAQQGISTGYMLTSVSTNGFLIEPVFYWPEARMEIHEATIEPKLLAKLKTHAPNPANTDLVKQVRREVIEVFARFGAAHFQIGRTYPYRDRLDPAARELLDAVKATLDPKGALSPGGLGLPSP